MDGTGNGVDRSQNMDPAPKVRASSLIVKRERPDDEAIRLSVVACPTTGRAGRRGPAVRVRKSCGGPRRSPVTAVLPVLREPPVLSFVGGRLASLARKHRVPGAQLAIHHGGYTVPVEFGEAEYGTRRS